MTYRLVRARRETSAVELAADDWWSSLSKKQQQEYIKLHPRSKYAKKAGKSSPSASMSRGGKLTWKPDSSKGKAKPSAKTKKSNPRLEELENEIKITDKNIARLEAELTRATNDQSLTANQKAYLKSLYARHLKRENSILSKQKKELKALRESNI